MKRVRYILLFPLCLNDGSPVPQSLLSEFMDELFGLAGGYTVDGTVTGAYRMRSGRRLQEELLKIWVVIKPRDAPALKRVVAVYAGRLGQESMYFEQAGGTVEFVEPVAIGGVQ